MTVTRIEASGVLDRILQETRRFAPPPWAGTTATPSLEIYRQRWRRSLDDPEGFWSEAAGALRWDQTWQTVVEWQRPQARWFSGGRLNASVQCLDRHLGTAVMHKAAFHWVGEPGDRRTLTYAQVHREVARCAAGLRRLGVGRGDRVAIYMPMIPELIVACLACARIGAVHTVVFGGFSAEALRDRIDDCGAVAVVTADGGWRRGAQLLLKRTVDEALTGSTTVHHVVVVKRGGSTFPHHMRAGRDVYYDELCASPDRIEPPASMEAEDPLFILYTSGTTGKPKGIVHSHAGYLLGTQLTTREVFDVKPDDVYWCTADIGWITGHSYVVYGPMQVGTTQIIYEGAPNWPEPDRMWQIVADYGVTVFYTAPTAIRSFMKWGEAWPKRHDLSSLRLLGSVGEPINPEAWLWYHQVIGNQRCPIVDTWWQTETGAISITPLPGAIATKPGSATLPFYGIDAVVLDEAGQEVNWGGGGLLAIRRPWPSMMRGIWGDDERYRSTYWSRWDGRYYFTGDGALRDEEGYFWIVGRVDDVVNISGHRIGTAELESLFVEHKAVSEAAVIGINHEIKGQALVGFVTLRNGFSPSSELASELREWIGRKIGSFAKPERVLFAADLPKTRSGKIMRRLLRDIAEGRALGDITTLADPGAVAQIKERYEEEG
jgi:acetyl-CoA synthetase